jgi:endonuclease III
MKNSSEYSRKLRRLYGSLKRKYPKVQPVTHDDLVEALVYSIVSENLTARAVQTAMKRLAENFIDFNDLRVSRSEEIIETLGEGTPETKQIVSSLTRALAAVFNRYNTLSLEALKKIGKRPAKQALEQIDGTSRFVVNYCVLTALHGHAIPLTARMLEYLRDNELVHPDADEQEIEGFLTRQIPARNGCEFYRLLRAQSELRKGRKKTTRKRKTKTKKKTKKAEKRK